MGIKHHPWLSQEWPDDVAVHKTLPNKGHHKKCNEKAAWVFPEVAICFIKSGVCYVRFKLNFMHCHIFCLNSLVILWMTAVKSHCSEVMRSTSDIDMYSVPMCTVYITYTKLN